MAICDMRDDRTCIVNCGLPGDQCACYRRAMRAITEALCDNMYRDPELDRIIEKAAVNGGLYES